jgi:hypothetical protein
MPTLRYPQLFPADRADAVEFYKFIVLFFFKKFLQVAIGWGRTQEDSLGRTSKTLLQVELPVQSPYIRPSDCADQVFDPEKQFCAGYTVGGKDTCQGDRYY